MSRFILEYDVELETKTKQFIIDNCNPSMVSPNGDSVQYCLVDVLDIFCDQDEDESSFGPTGEIINIGSTSNCKLKVLNVDLCLEYGDDVRYLQVLKRQSVDYIEICL